MYEDKIIDSVEGLTFEANVLIEKTKLFPLSNVLLYENAVIGKGTRIFRNCKICHNTTIKNDVIIGDNCLIREYSEIGNKCKIGFSNCIEKAAKIGEGTTTQSYCMISEYSIIGKNNFIAPMFNNPADNTAGSFEGEYKPKPASIGDNNRIGSRVLLKPNIVIGNNNFIGMGSLVTKDIPNNEMWFGCPAIYQGDIK